MGQLPTHPELLDWLALEFRDQGQSFKDIHRLILLSSTYRQTSKHHAANSQIDSGNQYLWRMNRRKLSAEEIRDSILQVSGRLNNQMGGPGYYLFKLEHPQHSPHYEYHLHDPNDVTIFGPVVTAGGLNDGIPPSPITDTLAMDVPDDEGGRIQVTWTPNSEEDCSYLSLIHI